MANTSNVLGVAKKKKSFPDLSSWMTARCPPVSCPRSLSSRRASCPELASPPPVPFPFQPSEEGTHNVKWRGWRDKFYFNINISAPVFALRLRRLSKHLISSSITSSMLCEVCLKCKYLRYLPSIFKCNCDPNTEKCIKKKLTRTLNSVRIKRV